MKYAIEAQDKIIREIAEHGSCVIVGRAADYVLKDNKNLIKIFIYANEKYKIKKLQEMYGDNEKEALKNMHKSDKNRASYYKLISGKTWEIIKTMIYLLIHLWELIKQPRLLLNI